MRIGNAKGLALAILLSGLPQGVPSASAGQESQLSDREAAQFVLAAVKQNAERIVRGHAVYDFRETSEFQGGTTETNAKVEVWWDGDRARVSWRSVLGLDMEEPNPFAEKSDHRMEMLFVGGKVYCHEPQGLSTRGTLTIAKNVQGLGIRNVNDADIRPQHWWLRGTTNSMTRAELLGSLAEDVVDPLLLSWTVVREGQTLQFEKRDRYGQLRPLTVTVFSLEVGGLPVKGWSEGWSRRGDLSSTWDYEWERRADGPGFVLKSMVSAVHRTGQDEPQRQETYRLKEFGPLSEADRKAKLDLDLFMKGVRRLAQVKDKIAGKEYRHLENEKVTEGDLRKLGEQLQDKP